eukprot:Tamp_36019.p1 GENE.Tamp_36019~~Tamp_36019.p1  ORF type:complete len:125 (+),score=11.43 Tamp_36019:2-376(+)
MTTAQVETARAFRETISLSDEYRAHATEARSYLEDDRVLHRFLSARKYDTQKAGDLLRKHLVWRFASYRPFEIRCHEVEPFARTGCIQVSPHGRDKWNRPILILDDSKDCIQEKDPRKKQVLRA